MTKTEENIKTYKWSSEAFGLFEATVVNKEVTRIMFCEEGSSTSKALYTDNLAFAKAVYQALGELFKELESRQSAPKKHTNLVGKS